MNLLERAIMTRNKIEKLEHDYLTGAVPIEKLSELKGLILLQIASEALIFKITDRKERFPLPKGLTGPIDASNMLVECPDQGGRFVDYSMCLDYSGSHETCVGCKNFAKSRKLLLPDKV